jgi:L-fuconolactonase
MYGSDWPVCRLAAEYDRVFGLFNDYVTSLSASEQASVLGGVAARFYRLAG